MYTATPKKLILGLLGAALLSAPLLGLGAELGAGEEFSLPKNLSVNDDLYIAGGNVTIAGDVAGDLVVAGGTVLVLGTVEGDVLAAGGTLTLTGSVKDDVRAVGGTISIPGTVEGDVVVAGGQIHIVPGATVKGAILAAGGRVAIDGAVNKDVVVAGGEIVVRGQVGGNVSLWTRKASIEDSAAIGGRLMYSSPREATIKPGAKIAGGVEFKKTHDTGALRKGAAGLWLIAKLLMWIVGGLALAYFFKTGTHKLAASSLNEPAKTLLYGFAALVLTPLAAILLSFTVVGLPLGILLFLAYVAGIIVSILYAGPLAGSLVGNSIAKKGTYAVGWKEVLGGVILLAVFKLVPFIGWFVCFVFFLLALGGVIRLKLELLSKIR